MTKRKVCVVTGSRSEYGLLYPILVEIKASHMLELQLISTSAHQSSLFGMTFKEIENDGFVINEKIDNLISGHKKTSIAKSTGILLSRLAEIFETLEPDIVLLLGDRYETHAAATTAMLMTIPIAHIHGGEITEGAVDEQIRHSITKMSYLHFCSTEVYRNRVIRMGEDPERVFVSGAPGIDNILNLKLLTKDELENDLGWSFSSQCALFTFHPETLHEEKISKDIDTILDLLKKFRFNILFTYANADFGGKVINKKLEGFCQINEKKYKVVKNLGQLRYLSAMRNVDFLVGNSSSGIIEAASFEKPVVNIGDRQKGRLKGENVIDCDVDSLEKAIEIANSKDFKKSIASMNNIYGSGNAADIILDRIINEPLSVIKKFKD
jgi:GDP/UDP-N,N'-diacetylbacillosamine 2-epimerase (hydrolysing)